MTALATKMSRMTKGSTKAVVDSSPSSNSAKTCEQNTFIHPEPRTFHPSVSSENTTTQHPVLPPPFHCFTIVALLHPYISFKKKHLIFARFSCTLALFCTFCISEQLAVHGLLKAFQPSRWHRPVLELAPTFRRESSFSTHARLSVTVEPGSEVFSWSQGPFVWPS